MFQVNNSQSGYVLGAYESSADYPTMVNWSRSSLCLGIRKPMIKWEKKFGFNNFYDSPIVGQEGLVYYGDQDGTFHAIQADGEELWSINVGQKILVPTLASDGTIYFGTTGPVSSNPNNADRYRVHKLYALNSNGSLKWIYNTYDHTQHCPVLDHDGTIYIVLKGAELHAINPNGTLKWKFKKTTVFPKPPVISMNGDIYIICNDRNLYCLDPFGNEKWSLFIGANFKNSFPFVSKDGLIYVVTNFADGFMLRTISSEGQIIREYTIPFGYISTTPVIGENGVLYLTASHFRLIAMKIDGEILWETSLEGYPRSLPIIDKGGAIYITTSNDIGGKPRSWIEAVTPEGQKKWVYKIKGVVSWPVLIPNKTMYVISQEYEKDRCRLIAIGDKEK